jgi:serine/threonine protein kinase
MDLLSKKGGARLRKVATYRLACNEKDVTGIRSLKTGDNDFGHVMLGKLRKLKEPVIVKVFSTDFSNVHLTKELAVLKRLDGTHFQRNLARYICDFSCLDDEARWRDLIETGRRVCIDNGPNALHFVVMEYVPDGDLTQFVRNASRHQLKSFITQLVLTYADLMTNFAIMHNDIHTGNILVRRTTRKTVSYHINGKIYRVKTEGFMPVLVDFGLAKLPKPGQKQVQNNYMTDEMMLVLSAVGCHIDNRSELKASLKLFMSSNDRYHEKLEDMIRGLRRLLKY